MNYNYIYLLSFSRNNIVISDVFDNYDVAYQSYKNLCNHTANNSMIEKRLSSTTDNINHTSSFSIKNSNDLAVVKLEQKQIHNIPIY